MTFATQLTTLPFLPLSPTAIGIVAPIIRLTTHFADILSDLINSRAISPEDQSAGLIQLREHAGGLIIASATISSETNRLITDLQQLVNAYCDEFPNWSREITNGNPSEATLATQNVLNRIASLSATLDRELAGIPSDPGRDV